MVKYLTLNSTVLLSTLAPFLHYKHSVLCFQKAYFLALTFSFGLHIETSSAPACVKLLASLLVCILAHTTCSNALLFFICVLHEKNLNKS
jgi:hypothetical protein